MAQAGDQTLVIQVTVSDISNSIAGNDDYTSLGVAVRRQLPATQATFSIGGYKMAIDGFLYNLDLQSTAYCNLEKAGLVITQPYFANLTLATFI